MSDPLLGIEHLTISLGAPDGGRLYAVRDIELSIGRGEIVGLAGESGSGKTLTALSVLGLLPQGGKASGRVSFGGLNLLDLQERQLADIRGRDIAIVFQDPLTSLHPMLSIGRQMTEHLRRHRGLDARSAAARAADLLAKVRIPNPREALQRYPHQFSGGMRQRIAIASALCCEPQLLIADEPTTALDVTVQAGILRLLHELRDSLSLSVLIITHDLSVMSALADRVAVMYGGRIVEMGTRSKVLGASRHPYTRGLIDALPHVEDDSRELSALPGSPPPLGQLPTGCAFHTRCGWVRPDCRNKLPALTEVTPDQAIACPVDPLREIAA
jgi:oligopeptide transport system ATP-binding protein